MLFWRRSEDKLIKFFFTESLRETADRRETFQESFHESTKANSVKFYFVSWGNYFNLKIKGLQWLQRANPLVFLADLIQQALTLTMLLGFSGNDGVLGVLKSGYSHHLEESSVL